MGRGSVRDALFLVPSTIVPAAASFVGMVALGHVAGLSVLGLFSICRITAVFLAALAAEGPNVAALRACAAGESDRVAAFRGVMLARVGATAVGLSTLGMVAAFVGMSWGRAVAIAGLLVLSAGIQIFESGVLRSLQRFGRDSVLGSAESVVAWGAAIGLASIGAGVVTVIAGYALASIAVAVVIARPRVHKLDAQSRSQLRTFSVPVAWAVIATYALDNGDQFVIAAMLGTEAVGAYALGYQIGAGAVGAIFQPIMGALRPRIMHEWHDPMGGRERAQKTAKMGTLPAIGSGVVTALALIIASATGTLTFVASSKAVFPVAILVAIASAIHFAAKVRYEVLLMAQDRVSITTFMSWVAVGVAVVSLPLLTWSFGIQGAAGATLISYSVYAVLLKIALKATIDGGGRLSA